MSVQSHTDDQTNSNENDHATGVEHHEESDTWECPDCGTLKPSREGAEGHCGDGDDNEGQEPREVLADRLREAGLSTERFIDVHDGEKRSTVHDQHEPNDEQLSGNYGVYAGEGLVDVDVDDYDGEYNTEALDGLPNTFTVRSPHGGEHRYYNVTGDVVAAIKEVTDGKPNAGPTWGEVRVDNQYTVGPGSQLEKGEDGCNKEWCDNCEKPDGGHYTILNDRSIATINAEELADVVRADKKYDDSDNSHHSAGSVDTQGSRGGGTEDFDVEERLDYGIDNDKKLRRLWNGDFSNYRANDGSCDRSAGIHALIQKLAFWCGKDKQLVGRLMDQANPPKWDEWKDDSQARSRELDAVYRVDETYSQSNTSSEPREPSSEYDSVADALVADPEVWIDPDSQVITAHAAGGMDANGVAESLKDRELPGDANLFDIASGLTDENREAFREFWEGGEDWTVTTASSDEWLTIRQAFADSNVSNNQASDKAFNHLSNRNDFATFRDTGEITVYDEQEGIYKSHGKTRVQEMIAKGLQEQYKTYRESELVNRIKRVSYCYRDEFGADRPNAQICVGNRILDLTEIGRGTEGAEVNSHHHSPEYKFLKRIPVNYNSEADCPEFDSFLDELLSDEIDKQIIYEMFGSCLWPGCPYKKAFFLHGEGNNGKTTLLKVLSKMLGSENVSGCSLHQLTDNRFALSDLYGKYANIAGELRNQKLDKTDLFKRLTGGDEVRGEEKGKEAFDFHNKATLIFGLNEIPRITDTTDGMLSRLRFVEFPNQFTGADAVPTHRLMERIASEKELEGILNKSISALADVFQRDGFVEEETPQQTREFLKAQDDPMWAFKYDYIEDASGEREPKEDVHSRFNEWAQEQGEQPLEDNVLGDRLRNVLGFKTTRPSVNGERVRVYEGISLVEK